LIKKSHNSLFFLRYSPPEPYAISPTPHSHSIAAGGFEVMSYRTRLKPLTSLMTAARWRPGRPCRTDRNPRSCRPSTSPRADRRHIHRCGRHPSRRRSSPASARQRPARSCRRPGPADQVDIDRVGVTQDLKLFRRDLAGAADREAWSRERMAANKDLRQAEFAAQPPSPRP
jgi:hypothetical protein